MRFLALLRLLAWCGAYVLALFVVIRLVALVPERLLRKYSVAWIFNLDMIIGAVAIAFVVGGLRGRPDTGLVFWMLGLGLWLFRAWEVKERASEELANTEARRACDFAKVERQYMPDSVFCGARVYKREKADGADDQEAYDVTLDAVLQHQEYLKATWLPPHAPPTSEPRVGEGRQGFSEPAGETTKAPETKASLREDEREYQRWQRIRNPRLVAHRLRQQREERLPPSKPQPESDSSHPQ